MKAVRGKGMDERICPKCNLKIEGENKFCPVCGTELKLVEPDVEIESSPKTSDNTFWSGWNITAVSYTHLDVYKRQGELIPEVIETTPELWPTWDSVIYNIYTISDGAFVQVLNS